MAIQTLHRDGESLSPRGWRDLCDRPTDRPTDRPLAIDLFCGLGGWTEGLIAEGFRVVGFDNHRHVYGEHRYPGQLVLQDVLTIHGRQFKDAALIVASPPCQEFSYMAMPWSKAKAIEAEYLAGTRDRTKLTALFDACFRIQQEANEAVRHHCKTCGVFMLSHHDWTEQGACATFIPDDRYIPLVVENVRGAQKWVGRSRWNFGSFHLWGDVPALMPMTRKAVKVPTMGAGWYPPEHPKHVVGLAFNGHADRAFREEGTKNQGFRFDGSGRSFQTASVEGQKVAERIYQRDGNSHTRHLTNPTEHEGVKGVGIGSASWHDKDNLHPNDPRNFWSTEGTKQTGSGREWFAGEGKISRVTSSKSSARKAASAMIAKIPLVLSRWVAKSWHPNTTP